jgi:recombination protein RecT
MSESTAVSVRQKADTVKSFIFQNVAQIKDALPRIGMTPDAVARAAYSQILKNPVLLDCDKGSLMKAIIEAAQLGLSFNLGRAYLVPYRNTRANRTDVQLIPGYLGLLDIARRSGEIASVSARAVYEGDVFSFRFGLEKDELNHDPLAEPDAKKLTHVYAIVRFKSGGYQVVVMTKKQVESVRARSKAKDSGPWVSDYEAMAIKTVLKRVLKLCPASIELVKALELDSANDQGLPQHLATDVLPMDDDEEIIDIILEEGSDEPKPTKTATVKEALKAATKKAEESTPDTVRADNLQAIAQLWQKLFKKTAEADMEVSAATGGKIQSLDHLEVSGSNEQVAQVLNHFAILRDEASK